MTVAYEAGVLIAESVSSGGAPIVAHKSVSIAHIAIDKPSTTGLGILIPFDVVDSDVDGLFSAGGVYNVPATGLYNISVNTAFKTFVNTANTYLNIRLNVKNSAGTTVRFVQITKEYLGLSVAGFWQYLIANFEGNILLNAGETFTIETSSPNQLTHLSAWPNPNSTNLTVSQLV